MKNLFDSLHDWADDAPPAQRENHPECEPHQGSWGEGSATALDKLRRQDFRGRRSRRPDDKPAAH